jgi:pre-mRNA cleavage complex 2 protein Pcf11
VSASTTPTGAGEIAQVDENKPKPVDPAKTMSREYCKAILSQKVKLSSAGLTIKKCKIVTCTLDKIVRQTRTPVAVTVVVGSMYVYAFIQYLNSHSYRLS